MDMTDLEAQLRAADEAGARVKLIATGGVGVGVGGKSTGVGVRVEGFTGPCKGQWDGVQRQVRLARMKQLSGGSGSQLGLHGSSVQGQKQNRCCHAVCP